MRNKFAFFILTCSFTFRSWLDRNEAPRLINKQTDTKLNDLFLFYFISDPNPKYTCDKITFEEIRKVYDQHSNSSIPSPLNQAAFIAPLNFLEFKPWSNQGFTLTTWLKIDPNQTDKNASFNESVDASTDTKNSTDYNIHSPYCNQSRVHLLSVGTNSLLLSIYICKSDVNTLYFHLTNPNVAQTTRTLSKSNSEHFRCMDTSPTKIRCGKRKCLCSTSTRRRVTRNGNLIPNGNDEHRKKGKNFHADNDGNNCVEPSTSTGGLNNSNMLSQTIQTTKLALKSSLSHFNLFSSGRGGDFSSEFNLMGYPLELKGVKLHSNKWMLFSMSASFTGMEIQLHVKLDSSQSYVIKMPCSYSQINSKWEKFKVLCIGNKTENLFGEPMSPTTEDNQCFKYCLSNVLLFRKSLRDDTMLANLYALGPDCVNFSHCQVNIYIISICCETFSVLSSNFKTLRRSEI